MKKFKMSISQEHARQHPMNAHSNNTRAVLQPKRNCVELLAQQHSKPMAEDGGFQTPPVFPRAQLSANLQGFKAISDQKQRLGMRIKASSSSRALRSDGCSFREKKMTLPSSDNF